MLLASFTIVNSNKVIPELMFRSNYFILLGKIFAQQLGVMFILGYLDVGCIDMGCIG